MSKILLVEDDLSMMNGLSFAFKKQGFEADIARTIQEADALWAEGKYDLLVLNIVNSISMSVSARIKQYGAMWAVGMDSKQITKMIAAEAGTYALCGCIAGCVMGLLLSKLLYDSLITTHYSFAVWSVPVGSLAIILLFVIVAAGLAVYAPAKRIRDISVTDTINEL